jgi:hypothetical protein
MKTTLMFRQMIANPRRTTLAHLKDATELGAAAPAAPAAPVRELPQSTANPRRTVLNELPKSSVTS